MFDTILQWFFMFILGCNVSFSSALLAQHNKILGIFWFIFSFSLSILYILK